MCPGDQHDLGNRPTQAQVLQQDHDHYDHDDVALVWCTPPPDRPSKPGTHVHHHLPPDDGGQCHSSPKEVYHLGILRARSSNMSAVLAQIADMLVTAKDSKKFHGTDPSVLFFANTFGFML